MVVKNSLEFCQSCGHNYNWHKSGKNKEKDTSCVRSKCECIGFNKLMPDEEKKHEKRKQK